MADRLLGLATALASLTIGGGQRPPCGAAARSRAASPSAVPWRSGDREPGTAGDRRGERGARARPPPEETPRAILADIFRYCLPLLGARAAFISGQNLSRVVLGKFFPAEALGLFSFAFQTVERFVGLVYAIPSSLLPSLTQLVARGEPERLRRLLDKSFRLVATLACALSFFVFVFAEELTRLLGGERYLPAVGLLRILALVPWVRTAHQPLTMALLRAAQDRDGAGARDRQVPDRDGQLLPAHPGARGSRARRGRTSRARSSPSPGPTRR